MVLWWGWMAVMAAGGTWWVRRDVAAYARFEALSGTIDRQHFYRRWLVESFTVLVGASMVSLWLVDALSPFSAFPHAFVPANRVMQSRGHPSGDHWLPMAVGLSAGIAVSVAIQWRRLKAALSQRPGPDAALIPRNRREAVLALLLSLNAGFSEELFFRLALPLLFFHLTGSLATSLAVSILSFGLAHAHYGWKGVLATLAAGTLLTLYYLHHGSLLRVMVAHAVIDVLAFFIRPAIADWIIARKPPRWAFLAA